MSKQPMTTQDVARLCEATKNAYSFDRYANWTDCALALANRGYSYAEAETILRSKWMRWAGDHSDKEYGKCTAADMLAWIDRNGSSEELQRMMAA